MDNIVVTAAAPAPAAIDRSCNFTIQNTLGYTLTLDSKGNDEDCTWATEPPASITYSTTSVNIKLQPTNTSTSSRRYPAHSGHCKRSHRRYTRTRTA